MYWTYALLGASILAVWAPSLNLLNRRNLPPWIPLFSLSVVVGLASGILTYVAAFEIAALAALTWYSRQAPSQSIRAVLLVLCAAIALAMALHLLPGFENPKLYDGVQLSENAPPLTKTLSFDKGAAGLLLLVAFTPRIRSWNEVRSLAAPSLIVTLLTTAVVIGAAVAIGYVRPDPKLPVFALGFLAANLLFTCVSEEVFFRGIVQERLTAFLSRTRLSRWTPAIVVALLPALFAAAHVGGGAQYVALAGLSGLGYAVAYAVTRRVEPAILAHFSVNTVHFLFFTYPSAVN